MASEGKSSFKQTDIGLIPWNWEVKSLVGVCLKSKGSIISGPFGSNIGSRFFVEKGIPVIRGNNLTTDFIKFVDDDFVFLTKEKAEELGTWAEEDDLVFTAAGTLGQVAIIPKERKYKKYIISNKQLRARLDKLLIIPLFAFYWFQSKKMVEYINMRNTGSTIPLINLSVLKSLPLPYPPIQEQISIVKILSDIDSKIELNQEMNKTLEAIGQALFKHWFVDFEFPNEEGKPYKSSGGEMVHHEDLGKDIPNEWNVSKIGDVLTTVLGGTPDRTNEEYWNGDIPWINSGKINEFRIIEPSEYITKKGLEKSATKLLPRRTTVLAITGATLGQVSLLEIDSCANQSVVGVLESREIPSEYIYFWIKHSILNIIAWQTGGAQQHINKENVNNSPLLIPKAGILLNYLKLTEPLFDKIVLNCLESLNLAKTCSLLLPKLMSGKIRVSNKKK